MLDIVKNVLRVRDELRYRAYEATVWCAIVSQVGLEYPNNPRALHMSHRF